MDAWLIGPPLYVVALATLYGLGAPQQGRSRRRGLWRTAAFAASLATLVLALDSPLDTLADSSFTLHMTQHILLFAVVPPLFVLAAPWNRLWRPWPLGARRAVARSLVVDPRFRLVRATVHRLTHPVAVWVLFSANLVLWHVPAAYDATLRNGAVHVGEHTLFLVTGVLFWAQVIPSPPFRPRLNEAWRAAYVLAAMGISWVLAIVLAFERHPLYAPYAALSHRPGGLTALADQQIAAGVMWVPGSLPFTLAAVLLLVRFIAPQTRAPHALPVH